MGKGKRKTEQKFIDSAGKAEQVTFDSSIRRGASAVQIKQDKDKAKQEALNSVETKQKLMDFIFGKTTENPMDEINAKYGTKNQTLDKKKYKEINVVSAQMFKKAEEI